MSLDSGYDAAYPVSRPPAGAKVVLGYLGGNTPHVWTLAEWKSQGVQFWVGIWTRSNPGGYNGTTEAAKALAYWHNVIGAPRGTLIALDLETAQDAGFVDAFVAEVARQGDFVVDYGSVGFLFGNPPGNAGYWPASLGAVNLYNHPHVVATQTAFGPSYDTDLLLASLPFYDSFTGKVNGPADTTTPEENDMPYLLKIQGDTTGAIYEVDAGVITHVPDAVTNVSYQGKFGAPLEVSAADFANLQAAAPLSAAAVETAVQAGVVAGLAGANLTVQGGLTQAEAQAAFTAALATVSFSETSTLTAVTG